MNWRTKKHSPRRAAIHDSRRCATLSYWQEIRANGALGAMGIAIIFWLVASGILMLREGVLAYRPGQFIPTDLHARVAFSYKDKDRLVLAQREAREIEPRVYRAEGDVWQEIEEKLLALPDEMAGATLEQLPPKLRDSFQIVGGTSATQLDAAAVTALQSFQPASRRSAYTEAAKAYISALRRLIILEPDTQAEELRRHQELRGTEEAGRIRIGSNGLVEIDRTYALLASQELLSELRKAAYTNFRAELQPKIVAFTLNQLRPTHLLDEEATTEAQNQAAGRVPASRAQVSFKANQIILKSGALDTRGWEMLRAEQQAYLDSLPIEHRVAFRVGIVGFVWLITAVLAGYVWRYQPRVVRNHARATAIVLLMLSMLLVGQLAGIKTAPLYGFGIFPTILTAMILCIAYDRRFALGLSWIHAILVTAALNEGLGFFLILFVGVFVCCNLLDEVRTRSKLIEVGGVTALAMMAATVVAGTIRLDVIEPLRYVGTNALYSGAAGLAAGFVVLGILPFIEKTFRITTSMTLLELADVSQPLLRRLALEAPGTYNHSLQVATLTEAAVEAIGGNSLLARVGSYYHDIGKMNKSDYFVENQLDGRNRHLNLSPSVSLLIIIGHVKDGVELAKEYNLPTSIITYIQQHHGTTLVEYFYRQAMQSQQGVDQPGISETQYRYPGPKPKTREIAVVMISDAVESACRCLGEPSAGRIETLVHELAMKRLTDGQFDECDLTMRELEIVERSLVKSLLGIYHGRIAYPPAPEQPQSAAGPAMRTA